MTLQEELEMYQGIHKVLWQVPKELRTPHYTSYLADVIVQLYSLKNATSRKGDPWDMFQQNLITWGHMQKLSEQQIVENATAAP